MIKKILRALFNSFLSIALLGLILFSGLSSSFALVKGWTPIEDESSSAIENGDNPLGIVIVPSEANEGEKKLKSMDHVDSYPDLGSPQIFPFEAGLGSS